MLGFGETLVTSAVKPGWDLLKQWNSEKKHYHDIDGVCSIARPVDPFINMN